MTIALVWVVFSLLTGLVIGVMLSPGEAEPTSVFVTQVNEYNLAITQIVGGPTYTPFPTYTSWPTPSHEPGTPVPWHPSPTPTRIKLTIPVTPPTPTEITFELIFLSWSVNAGDKAYAKIRTLPGTTCTLSYTDAGGNTQKIGGFWDQSPDNRGECSWTWSINSRAKLGTGTVTISANGHTRNYLIQITKP